MYRFDKISNIEQGPPQHLSHKPVMTMDAFRTTVLLRVAPMSEPETVSVSTFDSDADEVCFKSTNYHCLAAVLSGPQPTLTVHD